MTCTSCSAPAAPCSGTNGAPLEGVVREYPPIEAPLDCESRFVVDRNTKKGYFWNDLATPPVWECVAFCGGTTPVNPCPTQPTCGNPQIFAQSAGPLARGEFLMTSPPSCSAAIGTTSYQWFKRTTVDTAISGATASNYIVPLSDSAGGNYLLKVTLTFPGCQPVTVESNVLSMTDANACQAPGIGGMDGVVFRAGTNSSGNFSVGPVTQAPTVSGFPAGVTPTVTGPNQYGNYVVSWTGIPTTAGASYDVRVTATNACVGQTATTITNVQPLNGSGTVQTANAACPTPTLGTVDLPQALVGVPYLGTFQILNATSYGFSGAFGAQFASSGLTQSTTQQGNNLLVTIQGTTTQALNTAIAVEVQAFNDCSGGSQTIASLTVKPSWTVQLSGPVTISATSAPPCINCITGNPVVALTMATACLAPSVVVGRMEDPGDGGALVFVPISNAITLQSVSPTATQVIAAGGTLSMTFVYDGSLFTPRDHQETLIARLTWNNGTTTEHNIVLCGGCNPGS
jgi:hypothetical protein